MSSQSQNSATLWDFNSSPMNVKSTYQKHRVVNLQVIQKIKPSSFRKCEVNVPVATASWPPYTVCSSQYGYRKTNTYVLRIISTGNTTVENLTYVQHGHLCRLEQIPPAFRFLFQTYLNSFWLTFTFLP